MTDYDVFFNCVCLNAPIYCVQQNNTILKYNNQTREQDVVLEVRIPPSFRKLKNNCGYN